MPLVPHGDSGKMPSVNWEWALTKHRLRQCLDFGLLARRGRKNFLLFLSYSVCGVLLQQPRLKKSWGEKSSNSHPRSWVICVTCIWCQKQCFFGPVFWAVLSLCSSMLTAIGLLCTRWRQEIFSAKTLPVIILGKLGWLVILCYRGPYTPKGSTLFSQ